MQPQSNQYDFIMNPSKPPRRSVFPGLSSNPMVNRIILIAGLGVILLMLFVIASSLLSGGSNVPKLTIVAQDQSELLNLANIAATSGTTDASQANQNFTQTVLLSVTTDQTNLLAFLQKYGTKLGTKTLALKESPTAEAELNSAIAASNFDPVYQSLMQDQLQGYETDIKSAFDNTKNTAERQLLSDEYSDAVLLVKALNNPDQ